MLNPMAAVHEAQAVAVAKRLGYAAYAADMPRAPAMSAEVMAAVASCSVGDPLVMAVFSAYTAGFDAAASEAAAKVLAA